MNELEAFNALVNLPGVAGTFKAGAAYWALGKPAREAIGRLVGNIVEIPGAAAQWITQQINDDKNSRTILRNAIAEAAARVAAGDSDTIDRALATWGGKLTRNQVNKEKVGEMAIQLLTDDPPPAGQTDAPSVDFMNLFETLCENASSEEMQHLFSSILAGEIRRPRTYSLRTLQFIAVMDHELAAVIQKFRNWISGIYIIRTSEFSTGILLREASLLDDVGIIQADIGLHVKYEIELEPCHLVYNKRAITIFPKGKTSLHVDILSVTSMGHQIFSLLSLSDDEKMIKDVAQSIVDRNAPGIERVEICDLIKINGEDRLVPSETVFPKAEDKQQVV